MVIATPVIADGDSLFRTEIRLMSVAQVGTTHKPKHMKQTCSATPGKCRRCRFLWPQEGEDLLLPMDGHRCYKVCSTRDC